MQKIVEWNYAYMYDDTICECTHKQIEDFLCK